MQHKPPVAARWKPRASRSTSLMEVPFVSRHCVKTVRGYLKTWEPKGCMKKCSLSIMHAINNNNNNSVKCLSVQASYMCNKYLQVNAPPSNRSHFQAELLLRTFLLTVKSRSNTAKEAPQAHWLVLPTHASSLHMSLSAQSKAVTYVGTCILGKPASKSHSNSHEKIHPMMYEDRKKNAPLEQTWKTKNLIH